MDDAIYLNPGWSDEPDIVDLVNTALMTNAGTAGEALLIMAALAGHVSCEELYSIFGHLPSYFRIKVIPSLVKKGYLVKKRFPAPEGSSYFYYSLTGSGYSAVKSLIGNSQLVQKPRADKGNLGVHEFSIGYNLYQLIRFGEPFRWVKEAPYDNPLKEGLTAFRRGKKLFRSDCNAIFESDHRIVYIEEDRTQENISILLDKIYNYFDMGCFEYPEDVLLFSIKANGVGIPKSPKGYKGYIYSEAKCRLLLKVMEEDHVEDASLLIGNSDLFPDQDYLSAFVLRLGNAGHPVDLDGVREFHSVLNGGISPIQQADFNRRHENESYKIIKYIATRMMDSLTDGAGDLLTRSLLDGRALGVMPTTLLSSRLPFLMLSRFLPAVENIADSLSCYYGELSYLGESPLHIPIDTFGSLLALRNGFEHGLGRIFIEFPVHDIASWVRCYYVSRHRNILESGAFQLICVFDDTSSAEEFFITIGYSSPVVVFSKDRPVVYALCMEDLMNGRAVLYAPCGDGNERIMTSV